MEWLDRMNKAMDYIEGHLDQEVDPAQAARLACCSAHHFLRMFSFITDVPLSEYIRRRRLTLAAFELQSGRVKVIDVALKYGYDSPEAFSRAFKTLHGIMPTAARSKGAVLKAYPRLVFHISIRGDAEMNYRIEEKEAFTFAGVTAEISTINKQQLVAIPKLWLTYIENGTIDRLHRDLGVPEEEGLHAALYNFGEGTYSYMIGSHAPATDVPEGYSALQAPAGTWAVFPTEPCTAEQSSEAIQKVWKRIFPEWFPTSGYEHADGPEFEMYYAMGNGLFTNEVWIPIRKK